MTVEAALRSLEERIDPLERIVRLFAASLDAPLLLDSAEWRGFRYVQPDVRHFCLLKAVKALSALNAGFELATKGFVQETFVLMRTLVESTNHIEFVLDPNDSLEHKAEVERYMSEYFADSDRGAGAEMKRPPIQQGRIHTVLGNSLDELSKQYEPSDDRVAAATLYKRTYHIYSSYVHGGYPEMMDLYGGRPGQFHLHGMSGTRKEAEILEILDTFTTTVATTVVIMVQGLNLREIVDADPVTAIWYKNYFQG